MNRTEHLNLPQDTKSSIDNDGNIFFQKDEEEAVGDTQLNRGTSQIQDSKKGSVSSHHMNQQNVSIDPFNPLGKLNTQEDLPELAPQIQKVS